MVIQRKDFVLNLENKFVILDVTRTGSLISSHLQGHQSEVAASTLSYATLGLLK